MKKHTYIVKTTVDELEYQADAIQLGVQDHIITITFHTRTGVALPDDKQMTSVEKLLVSAANLVYIREL